MKVSLKPKSARIEHPVVPGLAFYVRRLTNTQRLILQEQALRSLRHIVEATKALVDSKEGEPPAPDLAVALADREAKMLPDMIASMAATLKMALIKIDGLEDEGGQGVVVTPANIDAVIDVLWGAEFIVPDVDVLDAKMQPAKAPMQCPVWLIQTMARPETFGPPAELDPKESQPQ